MTKNQPDKTKPNAIWLEAYEKRIFPDMESIETYNLQFLSSVNNTSTSAKAIINHLCFTPFSGFATSSIDKNNHKPILDVIAHPFKQSPNGWLGLSERIYGIKLLPDNPKDAAIKTYEIKDPGILFDTIRITNTPVVTQETQDEEGSTPAGVKDSNDPETVKVFTPLFQDFFDDPFIKSISSDRDPYNPLNNATSIAAFNSESDDRKITENHPKPIFEPRKIIPLTPTMIDIIFKQGENEFDGIINAIREDTWIRTKRLRSAKARMDLLVATYPTLQAFWCHAQVESLNKEQNEIFDSKIRTTYSEFYRNAKEDSWAYDKTIAIGDSIAAFHGYVPSQDNDSVEETKGTNGRASDQNKKQSKSVTFGQGTDPSDDPSSSKKPDSSEQVARDLIDFLVHQTANRSESKSHQHFSETYYPYKAILLASSPSQYEMASEVAPFLKTVASIAQTYARDSINQEINLRRKGNMRIDKTMAANMRVFQVFRGNHELIGNISFFHCYPRQAYELSQDNMSGAELEDRIKTKAISGEAVKGFWESKLGIALTANKLTRQTFNFLQYVGFQFNNESWLFKKITEVYEIIKDHEEQIQSIADIDDEFIPILAAKINNDFHNFLDSCMDAAGDIEKVSWSALETLPEEIQSFIHNRAKPNFIVTSVIRAILSDQRKENKKIVRDDTNPEPSGHTPPRKRRDQTNRDHDDGGDLDTDDREEDPDKSNPKVSKEWKMSMTAFKKTITPYISSCPKHNGKSVCAMFHIVGKCYFGSRCHHSHKEIKGSAREEMTNWIASCKKQAEEKKQAKKNKGGQS